MFLFTELEDAQATDREGRAGDCRRGRNEPHVEPFEPVARQVESIDDLSDLEDLVDAAAGGGTVRIAGGRDPEQGNGPCQPVGMFCRVGVWRKVDVDVIDRRVAGAADALELEEDASGFDCRPRVG